METSLVIPNLAHLTNKIAKQSDLTLELAHLTTWIAKQSNPILDLAHLTTRIAKQWGQKCHLCVVVQKSKANYEEITADISTTDRTEFFTSDQTFRQMSPSTPWGGLEQINWASNQMNLDKTSETSHIMTSDLGPIWHPNPQPSWEMRRLIPNYICLKEKQVI